MEMQIGLFVTAKVQAQKKADEFQLWLEQKGVKVIRKNDAPKNREEICCEKSDRDNLSFVFVLGGDGTFLRAVRWLGDLQVPICGIKFGRLGFLAEITEENLFAAARAVLDKKFEIEQRARLRVRVIRDNQSPAGKKVLEEKVLNDVVINNGALAKLTNIRTQIDDRMLTTYRADGLIISTPTGSTAYSLAAGGPIIHPEVSGIVITPICPFTLTNRPLIVPDTVLIKAGIESGSSDIMLTFDGQEGFGIGDKDIIIVDKWRHPVNMAKMQDQCYYDVLKTKLRWSGGKI